MVLAFLVGCVQGPCQIERVEEPTCTIELDLDGALEFGFQGGQHLTADLRFEHLSKRNKVEWAFLRDDVEVESSTVTVEPPNDLASECNVFLSQRHVVDVVEDYVGSTMTVRAEIIRGLDKASTSCEVSWVVPELLRDTGRP